MFELVPPKSKKIEYKSVYDGRTYTLKVFDFEEHNVYRKLLIDCSEFEDNGKLKGTNEEQYNIEVFKHGVESISGVEGKFSPSWDVIKEVSRKIALINEVNEVEK